jgi:hypothetical protein
MSATKTLEWLARTLLPPSGARLAKRVAVHPRFWRQRAACRKAYRQFGERYPHPILFIAGLPKSGTTWLERMISSYPGFHEILIPDVAAHELATGGSHDYELPDRMFDRFEGLLALTKMHVHGSEHNVAVLREAGLPYVVLYRDLRDVAVSNFFYMRNTPWHPEYPVYRNLSVHEGLAVFAVRTLPDYVEWIRSWERNRDPEQSLAVRYEDMLEDTRGVLTRVLRHFGLDDAPELVADIVERNAFRHLSGGRERGEQSGRSFFRKGVAGDWRNQFTPALCALYREVIGDFLVEAGYEPSATWEETVA